jgi:hypothetical protein
MARDKRNQYRHRQRRSRSPIESTLDSLKIQQMAQLSGRKRAWQRPGQTLQETKKAESSVLIQARTGKIGLVHFLYKTRVLGYNLDLCFCETTAKTNSRACIATLHIGNEKESIARRNYIE